MVSLRAPMFGDKTDLQGDPALKQAGLFAATKGVAWWEIVALIVITAFAAFLRYYKIGEIPPGFNSDEAVGAVGAVETLRSGIRLYYEGQGGGGALAFYIVALAFALFGPSISTIRGTAAFAGMVSVVATYFFVREAFRVEGRRTGESNNLVAESSLLAVITTLAMATSSWHFQSSRVAFAAIGVPFLQVPAFFFLWRGLNSGRTRHFILSGVFLASVAFIYMSGAFVPLVFLSFFLLEYVTRLLERHLSGQRPFREQVSLLKIHFRNVLLCALVAFICVLPVLYLYATAPDLALHRAQQALFTNPLINKGDPWGTLWRSWWGNLAAFGISSSWLMGQAPGNLIMPVPLTWLFLIGLAVSIWRIHQPVYLFTLLSWFIMIIPSVLSPDSIPHSARALGAAIGAYTLVAIGTFAVAALAYRLACAAASLFTRQTEMCLSRLGRVWMMGVVVCGIWLGMAPTLYASYHYYFNVWPHTNDAQAAFHLYAVRLAAEMSKETNPRAVFLLPRDTAAGDVNPNYTVIFLYNGQASYAWVIDDERTIEQTLNEALVGRDTAHVVRWKASKHTGADPKEIIRYFLEKRGRYMGTRRFEFFDFENYQLEQQDTASTEGILQATEISFGDVLQVVGYAYGDASGIGPVQGTTVPAGDLMWARLRVRLLREVTDDLKLSLIVSDRAGHILGQIDKMLLNNIFHQGTSRWSPGTETDMYFLVPILPATAPGRYQVELAAYRASDQVRLAVGSPSGRTRTAELGELTVQRSPVAPGIDTLRLTRTLHQELIPGLVLLGFSGPQSDLRPGTHATWTLVWQAHGRLNQDYHARLWLSGQGDVMRPISAAMPLARADFPTSKWAAGEIVRGWFDGQIPRDASSGEHRLMVRISDAHGRPIAEGELSRLSITSWERRFAVPAMQRSVGANFANQLELLGCDLNLPDNLRVSPEVVLYWRALSPMELSYTTFVHVLDREGRVIAQVDHMPGDGEFPTTGWLPGEVITDRFVIPESLEQLASAHQIEIGTYDPETMERLPVLDRT
ncbi:MAG: ArnT family glycosyltransferase, partial [Anaerolineae bacterium]